MAHVFALDESGTVSGDTTEEPGSGETLDVDLIDPDLEETATTADVVAGEWSFVPDTSKAGIWRFRVKDLSGTATISDGSYYVSQSPFASLAGS